MLSSSKFVVGSSRVKIPQFRQNVSARANLMISDARTYIKKSNNNRLLRSMEGQENNNNNNNNKKIEQKNTDRTSTTTFNAGDFNFFFFTSRPYLSRFRCHYRRKLKNVLSYKSNKTKFLSLTLKNFDDTTFCADRCFV